MRPDNFGWLIHETQVRKPTGSISNEGRESGLTAIRETVKPYFCHYGRPMTFSIFFRHFLRSTDCLSLAKASLVPVRRRAIVTQLFPQAGLSIYAAADQWQPSDYVLPGIYPLMPMPPDIIFYKRTLVSGGAM